MKYVLSFGGGLNSTALLVHLVKNNMPLDLVLFADTGNEHDYTYENVEYYKKWAENRNIKFDIVKSNRGIDLYTYCWDKKITPSRMTRNCTTNFKITPMRQHLKALYGTKPITTLYIGIAYEESHRMRDSDVKYITNVYPLVDSHIDRNGCISLLEKEGLPIPKKSGCWYCPFQSKQNWVDMLKDDPEKFDKAMKLELNNKYYPNVSSLLSGKPLIQIKKKIQGQTGIFDYEFEKTCDVSGSCFL